MRKGFLILAGTVAFAFFGCQKAPPLATNTFPVPYNPYGTTLSSPANYCAPGQVVMYNQYYMSNQCYPDLATACASNYGALINLNGIQVCKYTANYLSSSYTLYSSGFLPILNPDNSAGPNSLPSNNYYVMAGDTVTMTASGGYSYNSYNTSSWLGGLLQVSTVNYSCNDVTVDGYASSTQITYEQQPSGLMGSNGTELHFFGSNATIGFTSPGQFRVGFNAPSGYSGCAKATISKLAVLRCQDASNKTYACQ